MVNTRSLSVSAATLPNPTYERKKREREIKLFFSRNKHTSLYTTDDQSHTCDTRKSIPCDSILYLDQRKEKWIQTKCMVFSTAEKNASKNGI